MREEFHLHETHMARLPLCIETGPSRESWLRILRPLVLLVLNAKQQHCDDAIVEW
jgi:hypothetical protein